MVRNDAVISAAIRHPAVRYVVRPRHRPTRITWTSSGMMRREADIRVHVPRSIPSRRTIQRRNRFRRLHALPADGRAKKPWAPARPVARPYTRVTSSCRARSQKRSSPGKMSGAEGVSPSAKNCSTDPAASSICLRIQMSAARSRPRVQRCPRCSSPALSRSGSKFRTNSDGDGPITLSSASMEARILATRPKASPAAQNATISASAGLPNGRTRSIGSWTRPLWSNSR